MSSIEVKLGPNYELELPETLCKEAGFESGQPVYVFVGNNALHIVRHRLQEMRGLVPGLDWKTGYRDRNDRY